MRGPLSPLHLAVASAVFGLSAANITSSTPELPFDSKTTPYCSLWWNTEEANYMSCEELRDFWEHSPETWIRWNPSITADCGNFVDVGQSYCVEAKDEPAQPVPSAPPGSTSALSTIEPTPTAPSNGISTPLPIQPGMVNNCDAFYLTKSGDNCATITALYGVSQAQLAAWNPAFGAGCGGIWADVYVCVSIIGHTPAIPTPTPTNPGNGVSTPQPTQPGMVANCDAFYLTKSGDVCANIAASHGISGGQFLTWNPNVGSTCTGLWSDVYVCVSIAGHSSPAPTSTAPAATTTIIDGTSYPRPAFQTQSPTTPKCKRWHKVLSTNTCLSIANYFGITVTQLKTWNEFININCSNLWLDQSVCVSSPVKKTYWWPLGCYTDSAARALTNRVSLSDETTKMTPKLCQDACRTRGYSYAGIEFGSQCWCDNAIRNGHTGNAAGCTAPCPGKPSSHFCGGSNRLNVYRLDKYQDLGCYTDITENRSLKTKITGITGLTREICQNRCEGAGLALSGVEAGVECYCDDKNTGTQATGCATRCAGNQAEFCGGGLRVNVMKKPVSRSIGCWSDNDTPRLRSLKYQQSIPMAGTAMTPDLCRNTCRAAGFMFSGVEFGRDCWCDDKIHNGVATTGCNMPCPGNQSLMCGGALKLNIYEN